MTDPTDEPSARFDYLNAAADRRGWPASSHAHPARYGETRRVEKLEALRHAEVRMSAVRATVQLKSEPGKDRYASVRISACFQTGRYDIAYFDEKDLMIESYGGDVAFHKLYIERRDVRQALGTGFDMIVLGCLVRVLRDGGHSGVSEELADMRSAMRGAGPEGFRAGVWPKFRDLLDAAPIVTDLRRSADGLVPGRWVAVAKKTAGWRADVFLFAGAALDDLSDAYFRADPMKEGLLIAPASGETEPGFPSLDDMPLGADVSVREPTKIFQVPDALVTELRASVPPWFIENFKLDL